VTAIHISRSTHNHGFREFDSGVQPRPEDRVACLEVIVAMLLEKNERLRQQLDSLAGPQVR
jgi:hypothetical protein